MKCGTRGVPFMIHWEVRTQKSLVLMGDEYSLVFDDSSLRRPSQVIQIACECGNYVLRPILME
jgi:hypothetical protein